MAEHLDSTDLPVSATLVCPNHSPVPAVYRIGASSIERLAGARRDEAVPPLPLLSAAASAFPDEETTFPLLTSANSEPVLLNAGFDVAYPDGMSYRFFLVPRDLAKSTSALDGSPGMGFGLPNQSHSDARISQPTVEEWVSAIDYASLLVAFPPEEDVYHPGGVHRDAPLDANPPPRSFFAPANRVIGFGGSRRGVGGTAATPQHDTVPATSAAASWGDDVGPEGIGVLGGFDPEDATLMRVVTLAPDALHGVPDFGKARAVGKLLLGAQMDGDVRRGEEGVRIVDGRKVGW